MATIPGCTEHQGLNFATVTTSPVADQGFLQGSRVCGVGGGCRGVPKKQTKLILTVENACYY